jgi:glycosyltransferase involved in cell wall biosynthesis
MPQLSVVIPLLNEENLIIEMIERVTLNCQNITEQFEIIFVDDGSTDKTWELIENAGHKDKRVKGLKLSRNFGQHYAITAGLDNANGEWVVVMDGDLQDVPEVIPELFEKAQQGFDIVFVSRQNRPEKMYYLLAQRLFYTFLNKLSGLNFDPSQANYSIINSKVVMAFRKFPEYSRFYASTIKWLGFKSTSIKANHGKRYSGRPSYTLKKRIKLAIDIITAFSERLLNFSILIGATSFLSVLTVAAIGRSRFLSHDSNFLYLNINTISLLICGIMVLVLSIYGLYIRNIFMEIKHRPLYIVSSTSNIE